MAKHRGTGEGSISERPDGRIMAQFTVPGRPGEKPKRPTKYFNTKEEAKAWLAEQQFKRGKGLLADPGRVTLSQWLDIWMEEYKKGDLRPRAWDSYEQLIRCHIKPQLGHILLKDLRPERIQRFYNHCLKSGRTDGAGGLSGATVERIHVILHATLDQAMANDLITRNMTQATRRPAHVKPEIRVFTMDEQEAFLVAAEKERLYPLFRLALGSGMRIGELCGLPRKEVDLGKKTVRVIQEIGRIRNQPGEVSTKLAIGPPKTKAGRRMIPLQKAVIEELGKWKEAQARNKALVGHAWQENGLEFTTAFGKMLDPRNVTTAFYRVVGKTKVNDEPIPWANFHALRHTYATRLLEAGVHPKVVAELLGHSDVSVVLNTYSHVLPELKEQAVAKLDELFDSKKKGKDEKEKQEKSPKKKPPKRGPEK